VCQPGQSVNKVWRMQNNGSISWAPDTYLECVGVQSIPLNPNPVANLTASLASFPPPLPTPVASHSNILTPVVEKGAIVDIGAHITLPQQAGRYVCFYRLKCEECRFGPRVWMDVFVHGPEKEKADKEAREAQERIEREKAEKERIEKERIEKERIEREEMERQAENERIAKLAQEAAAAAKAKKEQEEKEAMEILKKEQEEKAEKERVEREKKLKEEKEARDKSEKAALEKKEREAKEKAEKEKVEREAKERDARLAKEKLENEKKEKEAKEKREKEAKEAKEAKDREPTPYADELSQLAIAGFSPKDYDLDTIVGHIIHAKDKNKRGKDLVKYVSEQLLRPYLI